MRHIQAIFSFIFNHKTIFRKEILGKVFNTKYRKIAIIR